MKRFEPGYYEVKLKSNRWGMEYGGGKRRKRRRKIPDFIIVLIIIGVVCFLVFHGITIGDHTYYLNTKLM